MTKPPPVEIRIWFEGNVVRVRGYLDEYTSHRDFAKTELGPLVSKFMPSARTHLLHFHGPEWKMDKHGKPRNE